MTTLSDPRSAIPDAATRVYYDEPAVKPPPLLNVGALAWIRKNLLRSTLDTFLTIGFGLLAISVIVSIVQWAIAGANWFVITKNLRPFMIGRIPVWEGWRVEWFALYLMFLVGFSIAAWSRLSRRLVVVVLALLAVTFAVPPLAYAATTPPTSYFAAGNQAIESGSVTETPLAEVAFIGRSGEKVTLETAWTLDSDEALAHLIGFTDRATAAIVNAATNRLNVQAEIESLEAQLQSDLLSEAQREALSVELADTEAPPPVAETLQINRVAVTVQLLDGETLDLLGQSERGSGFSWVPVVLPHDGWYILRKLAEADEGTMILRAQNVAPLMVTELSAIDVRYRRMTDDFETSAPRPQIDGEDVPMMVITDYQYQGERPAADFLRLHVAPFLAQVSMPFLFLTVAAALGYGSSLTLARLRVPRLSGRALAFLWLITPIVTYMLLAAVDPQRWGGLLLTFMLTAVGIVGSFPIGVLLALGRRSSLPIVKATCILFIELVRGVPLITILFMAQLMLPLLNPALVSVENVVRAMVGITLFSAAYLAENVRGGLQAIPHGQEEAAKALGLAGWQITLFILLPQALRAVIPALVGQCISLFKDTSLVAIVGLFDLTKTADSSIAQPEFIGARPETYLFISIIYFGFSYVMAHISRRLEESGSGAARRSQN